MGSESEYQKMSAPDRAEHLWRYTPWHRIHPTGNPDDIPVELSPALVNLSLLDGSEAPEEVTISALDNDIERDVNDDIAAAFIRALPASGAVKVTIPDGMVLDQPLLLTIEGGGDISGIQIEISVGSNSQTELLTIIESGVNWFGLLRSGTIHPSAIFNDIVLNRLEDTKLLRIEQFNLLSDCQAKFGTIGVGGSRTKGDLRYFLTGNGANLQVNGSIFSAGEQHNDHHVEIMHEISHTYSRLKWHSSCSDKSRTIGTGMLRIAHGAKGSDSAQVFNNLLLSRDAEADSIPELEVLENEVVGCGHGTANGPIDEGQMFYLQSRGFSESEAQDLLVASFLNATMKEMGGNTIHNWLDKLILGGAYTQT